jgi:hypothetical protein
MDAMSRLALAVLAIAALAAPAAAGKPDPFETYVANLAANPKAAASHLGGCQLILLPSGEARTPCSLTLADLIGTQPGVTLKATRFKYGDIKMSTVQYLEADVEARAAGKVVATFHVLEVGGMGNPDADWAPQAVHWARMISDKDAVAKAKAKQLPAAPAIKDVAPPPAKDDDQEAGDRDEGIRETRSPLGNGDLKELVAATAEVGVVFGSAPGQRLSGKGAARSIKGWKLALAQKGGVAAAGDSLVVFAATDIVGTTKDKSPTAITYATLIVGAMHMIPDSGDHVWETKMISFAVPQ